MPVFLCYEAKNLENPWYVERYRSMTKEFTKHHIKYFSVFSPEELRAHLNNYGKEPSSIVFFPKNENERKFFFERYGEFNIHKIIFSHHDASPQYSNFSSVMSDFPCDMELAISHLKEQGCKKIALFNASPNVYHDKLRIDTYKQLIYHEPLVFLSDKTVYPVLSRLLSCNERIDALLCTNDYSAFCLMLVLDKIDKNWNKKVLLLSFSNTILASLCSPSISSLSLNYANGSKEIATIHKLINKRNNVSHVHFIMRSKLFKRESTKKFNPEGIVFSKLPSFSEEELIEITAPRKKCMSLESLLATCDKTDLKILRELILSKKIDEIGKDLYLSYETVKYRIKKFKSVLGFDTTAELSSWLRIWVNLYNLEEII